ncbi:hypothetical protein JZK55_14170 [Dissulfurispira thermophila]|uniref:Uncharacterized protein n=1 Tax=Dissulfurispira thermophila TaxID=2715679 RepID=A0A7G1H118_9BACT|nr:hypothetical protein JZK55_14170 [Dissulfurispira thermophila]
MASRSILLGSGMSKKDDNIDIANNKPTIKSGNSNFSDVLFTFFM